jgi:hypothetical protein
MELDERLLRDFGDVKSLGGCHDLGLVGYRLRLSSLALDFEDPRNNFIPV